MKVEEGESPLVLASPYNTLPVIQKHTISSIERPQQSSSKTNTEHSKQQQKNNAQNQSDAEFCTGIGSED